MQSNYLLIHFYIMRKLFVLLALGLFTSTFTYAQQEDMKLGASLALPIGNTGDAYSFGFSGDFSYLFEVAEDFQVGGTASLMYYMGEKISGVKMDDAVFLPLAATGRYAIEDFFIGLDLGYGIGLSPSGNDGGFFYRPKLGYDVGTFNIIFSVTGVSTKGDGDFNSINAGVEFNL